MRAHGGEQTRLTFDEGFDGFPAWSPDGRQLAFASGRDGNEEIYTMRADGSHQTDLTNNAAGDIAPTGSRSTTTMTTTTRRTTGTTTEPPTSAPEGPSPCGPSARP